MNINELEKMYLNQIISTTELVFMIHRPTIVIKDRPNLEENYLEIDLGEISISSKMGKEVGRFHQYPLKEVITKTMMINAE